MSAIDDHVNQIVQNIVAQITSQVQTQAMDSINQKINEVIAAMDYTSLLSSILSQKLDAKLSQLPIDATSIEAELTRRIDTLAQTLSTTVQARSLSLVNSAVTEQINKINFQESPQAAIVSAMQNSQITFPAGSIQASAVDFTNCTISGDNIGGGIIKQFGSTGIDDKATACQVTILDDVTVIENNLLTKDLTVKGTVNIEGDLNINGTIPESSTFFQGVVKAATDNVATNPGVFKGYSDYIVNQIKTDGLDLNKITVNGQVAIEGSNLGPSITFSNLQRVGQLQELQVQGETLLGDTVYVNAKRAGINTLEPAQALSVWDQEIEVGIGKLSSGVAILGTPRSQTLIVGSNGKNNLTLTPDGATTVNKINMGTMSFAVGDMPPSDNQPKGSIVFNSNPSLGGPLGWVSLGDARWANFGVID